MKPSAEKAIILLKGRMHRPIKAIFFDLDGVLIDSLPIMRSSFEVAYKKVVDSNATQATIEELFRHYCCYLGHGFSQIMSALSLPQDMYGPYIEHSNQIQDRISLYPGVLPLLQGLRAKKMRLTVATGKDAYRAKGILTQLGILDYFELVNGSDEFVNPKPAPDMLLQQLKVLELTAPEVIFVGDSPADMEAGNAADLHTAGALWGYGDEESLARADFFLRSPAELLIHPLLP